MAESNISDETLLQMAKSGRTSLSRGVALLEILERNGLSLEEALEEVK